jgi:hypothetical protein
LTDVIVDSSFFLSLHLSFSIFRSNWQSYFMEVSGLNIIYWYIYADKELTTNLTSMIFRYVIHTTLTTLGLYVRFSAFLTTHNCLFNFSQLCSNHLHKLYILQSHHYRVLKNTFYSILIVKCRVVTPCFLF